MRLFYGSQDVVCCREMPKGLLEIMKPLLSIIDEPFHKVFPRILEYHVSPGATILDPTCGQKRSWETYFRHVEENEYNFIKHPEYDIHFSDQKDGVKLQTLSTKAHAVYFDPPYIWGVSDSQADREEDYGGYSHSLSDLKKLMSEANQVFNNLLLPAGKLLFKYCDVFSMEDRKFYFGPLLWLPLFSNFEVVDSYSVIHHHVGGTAYQVKNRPCSIGNFSYITILQKKSEHK